MAAGNSFWNINDVPQAPVLIHSQKTSSFIPVLQQTISNGSQSADHSWALSSSFSCLQNIDALFRDLLWHPSRFLLDIVLSAYGIVAEAPPLIRYGLLSIFLRYFVYKWMVWAINDYQAYLDLGRGGSTCDVWGWWRVTRLKLMAGLDVFEPPHIPPMLNPYRGILWYLPLRSGPRPKVRGIAPQRQINQRTPVSTFDTLTNMIKSFADTNPSDLRVETSFLEGHTAALKLNSYATTGVPNTPGEFGFEICHPHRNDGSVHMIMHPEDIRTVIEAGWAERHPLATSKWYWRLWYHSIRNKRMPVSEFLVLVYAPRDQAELEIVYKLLQASVWFATQKVLDGKIPQLHSLVSDDIPERRGSLTPTCSKCSCFDG